MSGRALRALLLAAAPAPLLAQQQPPHVLVGGASYYHHQLTGAPTASGEPYHPDSLTAAHRTLPFGTRVRVTNDANGREVVLRINDRGPFHPPGRMLDVSARAARILGFTGITRVSMRVLEPDVALAAPMVITRNPSAAPLRQAIGGAAIRTWRRPALAGRGAPPSGGCAWAQNHHRAGPPPHPDSATRSRR